jgi:hypothetical protein
MKDNVAHKTRIHPQNAGKRREKNCSGLGSRNLSPKRKRKGPDLGRRKQPKKTHTHTHTHTQLLPAMTATVPSVLFSDDDHCFSQFPESNSTIRQRLERQQLQGSVRRH